VSKEEDRNFGLESLIPEPKRDAGCGVQLASLCLLVICFLCFPMLVG
jgi:hypothetical protein